MKSDKSSLTRAHLFFQASGFKEGKDCGDKDKIVQCKPRVIVSFQENAWLDTNTYIHGMTNIKTNK